MSMRSPTFGRPCSRFADCAAVEVCARRACASSSLLPLLSLSLFLLLLLLLLLPFLFFFLFPRDIRNKYNARDYRRVLLSRWRMTRFTAPCRSQYAAIVYTLYACTLEKMKPALPRDAFISWRYPRYEKAGMPDNAAAMHAHPPSLPANRLE